MQKENHHYIPQFYLRNFSSTGKSIGMFINKKKLYIKQASIKKQASRKNLYGNTRDIENFLMIIESTAAIIIRKIVNELELPAYGSSDYLVLLLFLLLLEARVLKTAESQNNLIDKLIKVLAKMDKRNNLTEEEIDKVKIAFKVPNLTPMKTAALYFPILLDLKAIILISDSDRRFITSDNPLTRYNKMYVHRNYQLRGYGLGNRGIQLFCPISSNVCLCLYDDYVYECIGLKNNIVKLNKGRDIDGLNRLFYLNSMDYIFFNENMLKSYINRITEGLTHDYNLNKEISILGSENKKLIWFQPYYVKEKIRLPFMRIRPMFLNMPLPSHMAGPIRPYAKRFENNYF